MNFEALHVYELGLMQMLQAIKTPFATSLMHVLRFFDTMPFYLLLVGIVWYAYQPKWGARLLILLVLNIAINSALKIYFSQPRPYMLQPELGLAQARFFGFPSGAGQLLSSLFGLLILAVRKTSFTIFSVLFVLLVSFSRVFLGLHFPSDIVGGWVIGTSLLAVFWALFPLAEQFLSNSSKLTQCVISLFSTFLLAGFNLTAAFETKTFLFLIPGASIGLIWKRELPPPTSLTQRCLRALLASVGTILILYFVNHTPLYSAQTFFLVGLWISFGMTF